MIEAIIGALGAIFVCVLNNVFIFSRSQKQSEVTVALIEQKIDELTKQVDKHNQVLERMQKMESRMDVFDERMKVVNHRIDDLEVEQNGAKQFVQGS